MGWPSPTSTYAISLPRIRRRFFWYGNAAEIMLVVLFPKVPPPLLILALDAHDPQNHATSEMHIFFKSGKAMSALDQKQTSRLVRAMSALPPKADMAYQGWNVRFVPKGDSCGGSKKLFDDLVG